MPHRLTALFLLPFSFFLALSASAAEPPPAPVRGDGYRGIWYMNQPQKDQYKYKYSGGLGTYPQQHAPMAVYAERAGKTFFCFGGKTGDENRITDFVSFYDHTTGRVPRPVGVISRQTNDTHYNPSLILDPAGHVYVFANSHGTGYELKTNDPTHGRSFIFRSRDPFSIDAMEPVYESNFSYSQPWAVAGKGILWLHTRYKGNNRRIYFSASTDGKDWAEPQQMTNMEAGSYQISWARGERVATAIDLHPTKGGLNARTNLYYLETRDFGKTWTTAAGKPVDLPLADARNAALVHDFQKDALLVYMKDLAFDDAGNPIILYLTSKGYKSGPEGGPHQFHTARWSGTEWILRPAFKADHNYDHGSLWVEPGGTWRAIAPTDPGPQPFATGGQVTVHVSKDQGQTWTKAAAWPLFGGRNMTYVRRPFALDGSAEKGYLPHPDFYSYWADGNAYEPSESYLYFGTKDGQIRRLPRKMDTDTAAPEQAK